jgi:hypothetical protein
MRRFIVMRVHKNILSAEKIRQINDANLILRHFVELSSRLLPFLAELHEKRELTEKEQSDKNKIITVFNTYQFETDSSDILINSPVLMLIKKTYRKIISNTSGDFTEELEAFQKEYDRLSNAWEYARKN